MPEKTLQEALAEFTQPFRAAFGPPLLRLVQALTRHIERHPRFYRAIRVLPK